MSPHSERGTSPTYRPHPDEIAQPEDRVVASTELKTSAEYHSLDARSSASFRLEEDLLGTMQVPADAYYGIHTLRAVDNFQISRTTINQLPDSLDPTAINTS